MTLSEYRIYREILNALWRLSWTECVQVADRASVGRTTVWNWRNGKVHAPRADTMTRVARELGYDIKLERR